MSCKCNNKVNSYVDASNIDPRPWEDALALIGIGECGKPIVVDKPLYELTEEDREKLDGIIIDGDGTLFLANDGTYKPIDTLNSLFLTYYEDPANFVIQNLPVINRIKELVSLGQYPLAMIRYNQYVLPISVAYTASLSQIMFEYDAINFMPTARADIQRLRISIALNVETEIPTVVYYEISTPSDADYIVTATGDGTKALFDDGIYKGTYTKVQVDEIVANIEGDLSNVVVYNANNDIEARNNIILENDANLLGKTLSGGSINLIQCSRFTDEGHPITDIGSTTAHITLNSYDRPNVQLSGESGNHLHQVAYLSEVESLQTDLTSLEGEVSDNYAEFVATKDTVNEALVTLNTSINEVSDRVDVNTTNIAVNTSAIEQLREELNNQDHFRGAYNSSAEILNISNPSNGDYAYSLESGTIWTYTNTGSPLGWSDSGDAIPSGVYAFSDDIPLMDNANGAAGTATTISRSDHRHPSDITKANISDLDDYSGNSYIGLNDTSAKIDFVGAGAAGIDLITPLGTAKYNGVEIATVDDISSIEGNYLNLTEGGAIVGDTTYKGNELATVADIADVAESTANTYVRKSGDIMVGGLTLQGANITLDPDQSIRFSGNGATRIEYNTTEGRMNILTTTTDNGINVATNPSSLNSKFTYNGEEVAVLSDIPAPTVVIDNLSSTSSTAALSANQGRILDNKITDEIAARASGDTLLQNNIDAERTRAQAAEALLQNNIDGVSSDVSNLTTRVSTNEASIATNTSRITDLENAQLEINDSNSITFNPTASNLNLNVASSDEVITIDAAGVKVNVSLVSEGSDIVLYGNGTNELGRVSIATGAVTGGYYDSATQEIVIELSDGTEIRIPATDLVDEYTAGQYLNLSATNEFSLDYNAVKDQLVVDGFIDDRTNYYTKAEVDQAIADVEVDLSDYSTTAEADAKYVALTGNQSIAGNKTFTTGILSTFVSPNVNNTGNLGTTTNRWQNINGITVNTTNLIVGGADKTQAVSNLTTTGTGTNFLADDGSYKAIDTSSIEARLTALEQEILGASAALDELEQNAI